MHELVNEGRIKGVSEIRNESDLEEPVRLIAELKKDGDPDVILNQFYQFSPLQDTFSIIFLALVDGKPRILSFKQILDEFIRHRLQVIRRRTQFLLGKARQRKHRVEGLLVGPCQHRRGDSHHSRSKTQAEAKTRLMGDRVPGAADAAGTGRATASRVFQSRARRGRSLYAHARAGRRDPPHDARPVGQPGAGKAGRRIRIAARRHRGILCASSPTRRTSWRSSAPTWSS